MKNKVFVSTSIPYVNARPHIGHALEFVQTDTYARYRRLAGDDVFFTTGTDDNALKNVLKAEEANEAVQPFVRRHAAYFKETCDRLNISYDCFIETSNSDVHTQGAQKLWDVANKKGDIYKKEYEGLYCVGCEEFKTEKDINEQGECPEHPGKKLEQIKESNYFFKLSNYQKTLTELIESDTLHIIPETRKNEILSFIKSGLEDFSISRSVERAHGWGVPVPGDDSQVMYVWFDALSNYINVLDYAHEGKAFQDFWLDANERIHCIGKGINRFHTVYWPAMLLSGGIPLPHTVFVHGYFTVDGQKMSKSIGNVINPIDLIEKYGIDAVRYYFLRHQHPFEDGDFTMEKFHTAYTANLVNGLGNLVSRVMKLAETHLDAPVQRPDAIDFPDEFTQALDAFEFSTAMDYVWSRIGRADAHMTEEEPFKVVKTNPEEGKRIIAELVLELYHIARMLHPSMPTTSKLIKETILANKKPEIMFPRLDL
ncbi:TPA: methionine--tRNA ligase [Patescibacteria group bacterium]|nr:MAG: Methionine-tRNA ligase [Parcubacteria group bacterium GW2011_GWD2_42_14]HCC05262.1 methionine--tRNA ligase [Patescibacteria group bacterium]